MKRKSLNEKEVRTVLAVFSSLCSKSYNELNTWLGSVTIAEMAALTSKLDRWYQGQVLGKRYDAEYGWLDNEEV